MIANAPKPLALLMRRFRKVPQWVRLLRKAWVMRRSTHVAATSMDLCDASHLGVMLGDQNLVFFSRLIQTNPKTLIGWGRKWSGRRAHDLAKIKGLPFVLAEDGFLRSVGRKDPALSIVLDSKGVHYDASQPSRLEELINRSLTSNEAKASQSIAHLWRHERVSKYNDMPCFKGFLPPHYVLVIDQVAGDLSICFGAAGPAQFAAMLASALAENPDATVVVKTHPDTAHDPSKGHFDLTELKKNPRILIISEACHPVRLIANAQAVYTVTSQIGFEALIWDKPVHCFGVPFYAGFGLTNDRSETPNRRQPASLDQLVYAALIRYPRYVHPETRALSDAETLVRYVGQQRRWMQRDRASAYAVGFSSWKRPVVRQFLAGTALTHVNRPSAVPKGAPVVVWGDTGIQAANKSHQVLRIEDGFLRSAGLGADLIRPVSWVVDDLGIYYDPKQPSRLETILQSQNFGPEIRARASALSQTLIARGVSKYNVGKSDWSLPPSDRCVILVPGQVQNDASLRAGAKDIRTNIDLLQAVRTQNPTAYIIYKPHPDVVAGLRRADGSEKIMHSLCDQIVTDADPITMFPYIDEVHTMTSLLGFEALLRGVDVTCYGQPFYAGWGLTTDLFPIARRTAKLTMNDLVAGALILYPRYISRISGRLTTPEQAVAELLDWRAVGPSTMPLPRKMLRQCLRFWAASGLRKNA